MTDPRLLPFNGRVAHVSLQGQVEAETFVEGEIRHATTVCDMCDAPEGNRVRQLIRGDAYLVLDQERAWSFVQAVSDGYVGWIVSGALHGWKAATHKVTAPRAFALDHPDVTKKSPHWQLSFGSQLARWPHPNVDMQSDWEAKGWTRIWQEGHVGRNRFIRSNQIAPVDELAKDLAQVAELFIHTPYLWGGNSGFGIDCSGLVQTCLHACGKVCPRDADMQEAAFASVDRGDLQRGDLVFWRGHVGILLDPQTMIHANAHHMAVAIEPLDAAIDRIGKKEFGDVTSFRRP